MTKERLYKCLIIDDEPIAIEVVAEHLEAFKSFTIIGKYTRAIDALSAINIEKPDLIFLDINMPGISGITFMKTLTHPPQVIFTTAYREFAADAFEVDAIDYLLKPIGFERFTKAIGKFLSLQVNDDFEKQKTTDSSNHLTIKANKKYYKLPHNDILFIESLDNYIKVHTTNNTHICYEKLIALEKLLPSDTFIRIHRSFIVNISKINSFSSTFIDIGKHQLNIGRSYRNDVLNRLTSSEN